jgi:hypothetical protein
MGGFNEVEKHQAGNSKMDPTVGVYVTFARKEDAARCIQSIDGTVYEGRILRYDKRPISLFFMSSMT